MSIKSTLPTWQQIVLKWGISLDAVQHFNVRPTNGGLLVYSSFPGRNDFRNRVLVLNTQRSDVKNFWDKLTEHLPMPALFNENALLLPESKTQVYLANGEKSTMAMWTAGIKNVVNTFGEGNKVNDAIQTLLKHGVTRLICIPDCDTPGLKAALRWKKLSDKTDLVVEFRDLRLFLQQAYAMSPEQIQKWDTRDLWLHLGQDSEAFRAALAALPELDFDRYQSELPALHSQRKAAAKSKQKKQKKNANHEIDFVALYDKWWEEEVLVALERVSPALGRGIHRHCPNPHHTDKNPSFRISEQGVPQCSCGIQYEKNPLAIVAEWVNAVSWDEYKLSMILQETGSNQSSGSYGLLPFPTRINLNLSYISDFDYKTKLPNKGSVIIKSPLGTGKTELVKRIIADLMLTKDNNPRVLFLTHRQALSQSISQRVGIPCYLDMSQNEIRKSDQLVICYNSLHKLTQIGETIQDYDLVVIDEIEQFHQHLGGSTFKGNEAKNAYQILKHIVKNAQLFIGLDADASQISVEWLTRLRDDILTINNTYRPERGTLVLHSGADSIVAKALELAQSEQGPVLIPTSSRADAKKYEAYFSEHFGKDAVIMICSDNVENIEQQNFIRNINTELPKYRVLIYTGSLGSGIDITCDVHAVCGVFKGLHLPATELKQMMGRARNPKLTLAYVQPNEDGSLETDPEALRQSHLQRAKSTGVECHFDEYGVWATTELQDEILHLLTSYEAEMNRSKNDLLIHFITLMKDEGFTIDLDDVNDFETGEALREITETLKEEEKERVLAAAPVSHKELQTMRAQHLPITPEVHAGNKRYKIETCIGQEITPEIYDGLHKPAQRKQLRLFTSLYIKEDILRRADRDEARQDYLISQRRHHTRRRQLVEEALKAVWGIKSADELETVGDVLLTEEEICSKIESFLISHIRELYLYFNWRSHYSDKPLHILRRILRSVGLWLDSTQKRSDGKRSRFYSLDMESFHYMKSCADSRIAYLRAHLPPRQEELPLYRGQGPETSLSQNRPIDIDTNAGDESDEDPMEGKSSGPAENGP